MEHPDAPPSCAHKRAALVAHVATAAVVGIAVFGFRLLSEPGLSNDHFMHLAWAQQLSLGEMPGRDFVDPGMPLKYALSAMVQDWWQGPFSELLLSCLLMGMAAGLTCWLVTKLTGSVALALVAVFLQVILQPRLYGYPKLLVPALVLVFLWHYGSRPTASRLCGVAAATVFGVLLRYDLGAFACLSVIAGLVMMPGPRVTRIRTVATYAALVVCLLLPYASIVQWREGIAEHLREATEFSKSDTHQLLHRWDDQPVVSGWPATEAEAAAVLYYTGPVLALSLALLLMLRRRVLPREQVLTMSAAVVCLACYSIWIVRHPIVARVPDEAALLGIVAAAAATLAGALIRQDYRRHVIRPTLAATAMIGALALPAASVAQVGDMAELLERANVRRGVVKMRERLDALVTDGDRWPWPRYWPQGELPDAVRYLHECLADDERVLLTWSAPEYYYFSRRGFAGGQALFLPPRAFTTTADQQKMRARVEGQRVPLVLINETRREEFSAAYPEFDQYLRERYAPHSTFEIRGGATVTIAIRSDLEPHGVFGDGGWPCQLSPRL